MKRTCSSGRQGPARSRAGASRSGRAPGSGRAAIAPPAGPCPTAGRSRLHRLRSRRFCKLEVEHAKGWNCCNAASLRPWWQRVRSAGRGYNPVTGAAAGFGAGAYQGAAVAGPVGALVGAPLGLAGGAVAGTFAGGGTVLGYNYCPPGYTPVPPPGTLSPAITGIGYCAPLARPVAFVAPRRAVSRVAYRHPNRVMARRAAYRTIAAHRRGYRHVGFRTGRAHGRMVAAHGRTVATNRM